MTHSRAAIAVLALFAVSCASSSRPSRRAAQPSAPRAGTIAEAPGPTDRPGAPRPSGRNPVEDAYALWTKLRSNAEKALAVSSDDPNRGWLDRALDSDGRALVAALGNPAFDPFSSARDELRARILFVIKPPTPEDRREAIKAAEEGFAGILKRHRGG